MRPNVWTKLKEQREHGEDAWTTPDPLNKNTNKISPGNAKKRKNKTEQGERPRMRSRTSSSLSDMKVGGEQIEEKASKPSAAFDKIAQQLTQKG